MTTLDDLTRWQQLRHRIGRVFRPVPLKGNVNVRVMGGAFTEHNINYDEVFKRVKSSIPGHLLSGHGGTGTEIKIEVHRIAGSRYSDGTTGYRLRCNVSVSTRDIDDRWRKRSKVFIGAVPPSYFTKRPGEWVGFVHGGMPTDDIVRWLQRFPIEPTGKRD
jgi:hypothetical protein